MKPKLKPYESLLETNPILRLVIPLMIGIFLGDSFWQLFSGHSDIFLLAAFFAILIGVLTQCLKMGFDYKTDIYGVFMNLAMISIGIGIIVKDVDDRQVCWPNIPQNLRVLIVDTPKETGKTWQMAAQILSGDYAGRKIRLSLMKPVQDSLPSVEREKPLAHRVMDEKQGQEEKQNAQKDTDSRFVGIERVTSPTLMAGDVVLLHAIVQHPENSGNPLEFDYARWMMRQGFTGTAFCFSGQWKKSDFKMDHLPFFTRALQFRDRLVLQYKQYFEGRNLAVLSAMTLGDKTRLDQATRELFSQTGVSHILALSGLHLSILFCIYRSTVLSLFRRRWLLVPMSVLGIVGLWLFALMAGLPLSLVRAAIMFSIVQLMSCFRHDSFSVNNLALAALLLLASSPQSLFDIGFQLSFLSVFFIILFVDSVPRPQFLERESNSERSKRRGPFHSAVVVVKSIIRWGYDVMATSVVAQLGTAPLVAYYFHSFPVYGMFVNLVVIPIAYVILVNSLLFFSVSVLQNYWALCLGIVLQQMDHVLTLFSGMPCAHLELHPTLASVGMFYLLIFAMVHYLIHRKYQNQHGLYGAIVLTTGIFATELYAHRPGQIAPQLVVYNLHQIPVLHCLTPTEPSFLWSTDTLKATRLLQPVAKTFWEGRNILPPLFLKGKVVSDELYFDGRVLAFNGYRLGLCYGPLPIGKPEKPLPVDVLFLARGARADLKKWLDYYRPGKVVLDASLTDYYYRKYRLEADEENLAVYDIENQGALVLGPKGH